MGLRTSTLVSRSRHCRFRQLWRTMRSALRTRLGTAVIMALTLSASSLFARARRAPSSRSDNVSLFRSAPQVSLRPRPSAPRNTPAKPTQSPRDDDDLVFDTC